MGDTTVIFQLNIKEKLIKKIIQLGSREIFVRKVFCTVREFDYLKFLI